MALTRLLVEIKPCLTLSIKFLLIICSNQSTHLLACFFASIRSLNNQCRFLVAQISSSITFLMGLHKRSLLYHGRFGLSNEYIIFINLQSSVSGIFCGSAADGNIVASKALRLFPMRFPSILVIVKPTSTSNVKLFFIHVRNQLNQQAPSHSCTPYTLYMYCSFFISKIGSSISWRFLRRLDTSSSHRPGCQC